MSFGSQLAPKGSVNGAMNEALELFWARQYPGVVAVCSDTIDLEPEHTDARILLARALLALRRDLDAQHELRHCLRIDPRCGAAYRLLGELALRRDEPLSAHMFLKEALRLDAGDAAAASLLRTVDSLLQPTAEVEKLPAATAAAGCAFSPKPRRAPSRPPRLETGSGNSSGFGKYLLRVGILNPAQLSAVIAHHEQSGVRVGSAAVELGFISAPKVEWAALAYHSARRSA